MKNSIKNKTLRTLCENTGRPFGPVRQILRRYRREYYQGYSRATGLNHGQRMGWETPETRMREMGL
jgi:hypothetical protein